MIDEDYKKQSAKLAVEVNQFLQEKIAEGYDPARVGYSMAGAGMAQVHTSHGKPGIERLHKLLDEAVAMTEAFEQSKKERTIQ